MSVSATCKHEEDIASPDEIAAQIAAFEQHHNEIERRLQSFRRTNPMVPVGSWDWLENGQAETRRAIAALRKRL